MSPSSMAVAWSTASPMTLIWTSLPFASSLRASAAGLPPQLSAPSEINTTVVPGMHGDQAFADQAQRTGDGCTARRLHLLHLGFERGAVLCANRSVDAHRTAAGYAVAVRHQADGHFRIQAGELFVQHQACGGHARNAAKEFGHRSGSVEDKEHRRRSAFASRLRAFRGARLAPDFHRAGVSRGVQRGQQRQSYCRGSEANCGCLRVNCPYHLCTIVVCRECISCLPRKARKNRKRIRGERSRVAPGSGEMI